MRNQTWTGSHGNKNTHHERPGDEVRTAVAGGTKLGPVVMAAVELSVFLKVPVVEAPLADGAPAKRRHCDISNQAGREGRVA